MSYLLIFEIISILFSLVLIVSIVRMLIKMDFISGQRDYGWHAMRSDSIYKSRVEKAWTHILKHIASNDPSLWKKAVNDADVLFDEIVRSLGHRGATPEERLSKVDSSSIENIDVIKTLHEAITPLLADDTATLNREKAKEILRAYRIALRQLGLLAEKPKK